MWQGRAQVQMWAIRAGAEFSRSPRRREQGRVETRRRCGRCVRSQLSSVEDAAGVSPLAHYALRPSQRRGWRTCTGFPRGSSSSMSVTWPGPRSPCTMAVPLTSIGTCRMQGARCAGMCAEQGIMSDERHCVMQPAARNNQTREHPWRGVDCACCTSSSTSRGTELVVIYSDWNVSGFASAFGKPIRGIQITLED
jgi:hypothetical protein